MAKKRLIEALEDETVEQLEEIRAFRTNRSASTFETSFKRAKVSMGVLGAYVRLRATIANEETNRLVSLRLEAGAPAPRSLPDGK